MEVFINNNEVDLKNIKDLDCQVFNSHYCIIEKYSTRNNSLTVQSLGEHDKEIRAEFEKEMEIKKRRFDLIYQENQMLIKELTNLKFNNKNENEQLKTELAELKKNAIVPKFKIGQKVWIVGYEENAYGVFPTVIQKTVTGNIQKQDFDYCELNKEKVLYIDLDIYTTQAEAEQNLAKIKGE